MNKLHTQHGNWCMFCHYLLIVRQTKDKENVEEGKEKSDRRGKKITLLSPALIEPRDVQVPERMPHSLCGGTFL